MIRLDTRTEVVHGIPIDIVMDRHKRDMPGFWCMRSAELGDLDLFDSLSFGEWLYDSDLTGAIALGVDWAESADGRCYASRFGLRFSVADPRDAEDFCVEGVADSDAFTAWIDSLGVVEQFAEEGLA